MKLSPKEKEVLALLALGYSDKEIGLKMNIAYCTVRSYVDKSILKLNAKNRTNAAVIYSLKNFKDFEEISS